MTGEAPNMDDTLRALARAGIQPGDDDIERMRVFVARLRELPPPGAWSEPWALPLTREWPRD